MEVLSSRTKIFFDTTMYGLEKSADLRRSSVGVRMATTMS